MYKPDNLPQPIPQRIQALPKQHGFPVPWFVAEIDGKYDFRIADGEKLKEAVKRKKCWICGQQLGSYLAFPISPMCAINRTIPEPPSHRECAEWAIKACPFLAQRQEYRRETNLPDGVSKPGGIAIKRQPGATCLWMTKSFEVWQLPNGIIFKLGEPTDVIWFKEGRQATREEVLESINSGYSVLLDAAKVDGDRAIRQLERMRDDALKLIPKN